MFSFNLNQSSTTVNYMAEFQDDGQGSHLPSLDMAAGRAPRFIPCPGVFSILHDQGDHGDHRSHRQEEANDQSSNGVTIRCRLPSRPQEDDAVGRNLKLSLCDHYVKEEEEEEVGGECAWMPSKMRIMRKMMNADRSAASRTRRQTRSSQDRVGGGANHVFGSTGDGNISPSGGDVVRVCSDCHTTKTPLWRTGPCGPKSLCNACGIRQRKARRAMAAAAAAAANGSTLMPSPAAPTKARKEKKPLVVDDDRTVPFKKRCKFAGTETASQAKLDCFEDVTLTLGTSSTSSSTHRPFPQDERDAAILLMALSYGLVRS